MAIGRILSFVFLVGVASVSTEDTLSNHPSVAQVELLQELDVWGQNCVANILTRRSLLTATSCFTETSIDRRIRAGALFRNNGGVILYIERVIDFQSENTAGDISVIRLASPLSYTPLIRQTSIPESSFILGNGFGVTQVGWSRNDYPSSALIASRIGTVSSLLCGIQPAEATANRLHCARYTRTTEVPNGQPGGPWFINNITVAVASMRSTENYWPFNIGTAVAPFTNWIMSVSI